jgi:hypothetical protein
MTLHECVAYTRIFFRRLFIEGTGVVIMPFYSSLMASPDVVIEGVYVEGSDGGKSFLIAVNKEENFVIAESSSRDLIRCVKYYIRHFMHMEEVK